MKKIRLILFAIALLCAILVFSSCSILPSLPTPGGIAFDEIELILTWESVPEAIGYAIDINGKQINTRATRFPLSTYLEEAGTYEIKVKSLGDDIRIESSTWSESVTFVREPETGILYRLVNNNSAYEVSSVGTATGDVVVKTQYRGRPVVGIAKSAFANNKMLNSVVIEEGITYIGERAFYNCSYLETVSLPSTLQSIGEYAFQSCRRLQSIDLPEGVTVIEPYTFSYCRSLTTVRFGNQLTAIMPYAFTSCDMLTSPVFPETLVTIGQFAFENCKAIKTLQLPNSLTEVEEGAFSRCAALDLVHIGSGLTVIPKQAFYSCEALVSITIPDTVREIGENAFTACTLLSDVQLGSGVEKIGMYAFSSTACWNNSTGVAVYIGNWLVGIKSPATLAMAADAFSINENIVGIGPLAFRDCITIMGVAIPDTVRFISDYAFYGCTALSLVKFGKNVETIGRSAFQDCKYLDKLEFTGNALTRIEANAFYGCERLGNTFTLPASLTAIGSYAFRNTKAYSDAKVSAEEGLSGEVYIDKWLVDCKPYGSDLADDILAGISGLISGTNKINVTVKDGTVGIAEYAFYKHTGLTTIFVPASVRTIGKGAFYGCEGLTYCTLNEGITEIKDYTFYRCYALGSSANYTFAIPATVERIGRSAFHECASLQTMTFPASVTYFSDYAFYNCQGLAALDLGDSVRYIGNNAFASCKAMKTLNIGNGLEKIGTRAFDRCSSLQSVTFGNTVQEIGSYAFYKCVSLTELVFPASLKQISERAFYGCTSIRDLILPNTMEAVGPYAFYGCGLISVQLGTGVKSIGEHAFRNLQYLRSIVIPASVETIGAHAFFGCKQLTIYMEPAEAPAGWHKNWNSSFRPTLFGCTLSEEKTYVTAFAMSDTSIRNAELEESVASPSRAGYKFVGWSTTGTAAQAYYAGEGDVNTATGFAAAYIAKAPTGKTYYAIWELDQVQDLQE